MEQKNLKVKIFLFQKTKQNNDKYFFNTGFFDFKNLSFSINPNICLFPENIKRLIPGKAPKLEKSRKIGDICFEVSYLLKSFRSQYYTKDEFNDVVGPELQE